MVRVSDSAARGWGFDPHSGYCLVSLRKANLLPKSTVNTRKRWLRPNMTLGLLRLKSTKCIQCIGYVGYLRDKGCILCYLMII